MNKKEKLLLLGVDSTTQYAVAYAKSQNVWTIITDYNTPEASPAKLLSDEYWMVNVGDLDELEKRCREENITAVFAGCHEFCLDMAKELAARLGFPFYASEEAWKTARDKTLFKKHCAACGIDTPHRYAVDQNFDPEIMATINYPVITKPTDASSQKGFSICRDEEELRKGYAHALEFSGNGDIIVEEFVEGDEYDILYYVEDGVSHLMCLNDRLGALVNERINQTFTPTQSLLFDDFKEKLDDKIQKIVTSLEYQNGVLFFQAIHRDGIYYFLEMGGRIDGIGTWTCLGPCCGFNYLNHMVDIALGRKPVIDWSKVDFSTQGKHSAIYLYWSKPGHIAEIKGLEETLAMDGISMVINRFRPGDTVHKTDNMLQIAYFIGIVGDSTENLIAKLQFINENLQLIDDDGKNMMIPYLDYDFIRANY